MNTTAEQIAALVDEPAYIAALDELIDALDTGDNAAYDRLARTYPRYAAALLDAALTYIRITNTK